jgi:hypothetical protein
MAEIPLALLLIELEKAELREAMCDSELESSSVAASLGSSKLLPTARIEAMRLGSCGEGVGAAEDRGGGWLVLATPDLSVGIGLAASSEAGVSEGREFLRPCSKPLSRDFVEVVLLCEGAPAPEGSEVAGISVPKKPLNDMVSTTVCLF